MEHQLNWYGGTGIQPHCKNTHVRCNWCMEIVGGINDVFPEDEYGNEICPNCEHYGCLMDISCTEMED